MKLLFVHDRFGDLAGAEANLHATAAALQERGHQVGLIHGPRTGKGELAWHGTFNCRWALDVAPPSVVVERAVEGFEPDLIYIHNMGQPAVTGALLDTGLPLVRMVHDHHLFCLRGCKYHPFSRRVCTRPLTRYCVFPCGGAIRRVRGSLLPVRWVSYAEKKRDLELHKRFQRLIVASQYMKDELVINGVAPDRIAIHAPVPRSVGSRAGGASGDRNLIVYAGQLVRGKGVDVLIEALSLVETPFECVILGSGSHRAYCERLAARLKLSGRVRFAGFVPQERLGDYYQEARLAVLSSVWPEPFGAVGLEAMRCGLPVVAFDTGGIREWLIDGFNGFLVPWMDRIQFAARVETLLRDKDLARSMGMHAKGFAGERFSFANYIHELEGLFAGVLEETRCLAPA